ncbi:MAG: VanW family protein [Bifidobacteriaceae bacterium]|nr:VanW family protein [Bifidobacteriaceae bacterium]
MEIEDKRIELPEQILAEAATITPIEGQLTLNLDDAVITEAVKNRLPDGIESKAKNARFVFENGKPVIRAGTPGRSLDFPAITSEVALAAQSTMERTAKANVIEVDPKRSEAELRKLGIKEVVGAFDTQAYAHAGRTANLKLAAEKVTGVLVKPGETFSLNKVLGPRTYANGWHDGGVVENGVLKEGIGGGLSQFSTTLYNAAHLAGFEDVEHQPHMNYFSRYPRTREATLWEGVIDNRFKNNTPYGAILRAWVTDSLVVNVEVWSTEYWEVESVIGPQTGIVAPRVITQPAGPGCVTQAKGSPGFTTTETRTLSLDGEVKEVKEWTWTYQPTNGYACESPEKKKKKSDDGE